MSTTLFRTPLDTLVSESLPRSSRAFHPLPALNPRPRLHPLSPPPAGPRVGARDRVEEDADSPGSGRQGTTPPQPAMILSCVAPFRRFTRDARRTSGTPSAIAPMPNLSKLDRSPTVWLWLENPASPRSRKSPCPDVWLMNEPLGKTRGPSTRPLAVARMIPNAGPPMSLTDVKPSRRKRGSTAVAALMAMSVKS